MSVKQIIKEAIDRNPIGLKEAMEEELRNRVSSVLEAKMAESVLTEKVEKIACLECDEVSTRAAWKKNGGTCPKCNESTRGVAESAEDITEDKFSDFWNKVFLDLDSKMKKFDDTKISDVNKASKHIQHSIPRIPQSKAMAIAIEYSDYRSGAKTRERAVADVTKIVASAQRTENIEEASYQSNIDPNKKIVVSGVKGMKSAAFTKKFKNMAAYDKWSDSEEAGNYEVRQITNEDVQV